MKIPLFIASDFRGLLEGMYLLLSFWVTAPLSVLALFLSLFTDTKRALRVCTIVAILLYALQLLAVLSLSLLIPGLGKEDRGMMWYLLLPPALTTLSLFISRFTHKPTGKRSKDVTA